MPRVSPAAAVVALAAVAVLATGCEDDGAAPSEGGSKKPNDKSSSAPDDSDEQPDDPKQPDDEGGQPDASKQPDSSSKPGDQKVDADLGDTLKLGESTRISYKRAGDRTGTMELTAQRVVKGSQQDLGEASLDGEQRGMQPYYVTVKYKNIGDKSISAYDTPTALRDGRGEDADPVITVNADVSQCRKAEAYKLAVDATVTNCKVFLLPKGQQPSVVKYTGDFDKEPVFWKTHG